MLYILYGEDTYRSRKKMREITERFYAVAGSSESVYRVVLSECSREALEAVLGTGSLFRDKRLVLLEEPSEAPADVLQFLESKLALCAASDDVFVIWDRVAQTGATDFIKTSIAHAAKAQEFSKLSPHARAGFVDEELTERGISLSAKEKQELLREQNGDSWRLVQSIEKRALGAADGSIFPTHRKEADRRMFFSFTDACGLRQRAEAWKLFHELLQDGAEPERIFWALISHLKTLLSVGSLLTSGIHTVDIHRMIGLHPFVVKKAVTQARYFSERELASLYSQLALLDFETKQSRGDLALGVERIVLSL